MREPPLYGLDIETDTSVDGLDPATSAVVAVAVTGEDPADDHVFLGEERSILRSLDDHLRQLPPGVLVTWNGSGFDLPFLDHRSHLIGVPVALRVRPEPAPPRPVDGARPTRPDDGRRRVVGAWGDHLHLDGYRLYRADVGRSLGFSCGLKPLSRLVGLRPVEVRRERIHLLDDAALREYVASDARLARALVARRMPAAWRWVDRLPGCSVTDDVAPAPDGFPNPSVAGPQALSPH
jgi:hypothetical protein